MNFRRALVATAASIAVATTAFAGLSPAGASTSTRPAVSTVSTIGTK